MLAKNEESLWLYSNPPHFENESEIVIADFTGDLYEKRIYFEKLEKRYGKRWYLLSGVHFNFSFDDKYLWSIFQGNDFEVFKRNYYLKLYKQLYVHSWMLLLLTAASPVYDRSLTTDGEKGVIRSEYSSIRNSAKGYWNQFLPVLNLDSYDDFVKSLKCYMDNGSLYSLAELYLPVRLKPNGGYSVENLEKGVSHIEFRMFDTNPFEPLGINRLDLEFTHLLVLYLSTLDDFDLTPELQKQALENHKSAALYDLSEVKIDGTDILEKADNIIDQMCEMFRSDSTALEILQYERSKLNDRPCTHIIDFKFI